MTRSGLSHLVLPAVVGLKSMRDLAFYLHRQIKISSGELKLGVDFVDGNPMVDKTEEANGLGSLQQLLSDLFLSGLKV